MGWPSLDGTRILVTGATGFVGGRIVERLCLETHARVGVGVRRFRNLPRVARFDVDIVKCDLLDKGQVEAAVSGYELVIHCAYGSTGDSATQARVTIQGTENLLEAAQAARVRRLVHFSTAAVYGLQSHGDLNEATPYRQSSNTYMNSKLEAEKLVFRYANAGLNAIVLQPTIIYGPFGTTWTADILRNLSTGQVILVDGGEGSCNPVYVDDVVDATFLAASTVDASGEALLISSDVTIPWHRFLAMFEEMLGQTRTISMTKAEALDYWKQASPRPKLFSELKTLMTRGDIFPRLLRTRQGHLAHLFLRRILTQRQRQALLRRRMPDSQSKRMLTHPLSPPEIEFFGSKSSVKIDKARRLIGFHPAVSLEQGMRLTELWAMWANLIPFHAEDPP